MSFVMLTITSRQMCFGSLHKTIWQQSKKFAARNCSRLRNSSALRFKLPIDAATARLSEVRHRAKA